MGYLTDRSTPAAIRPDTDLIAALRPLAVALFQAMRDTDFDGIGISRPSYDTGETRALQRIADIAAHEGLAVWWDATASLVVDLPGRHPGPWVATGSHLDSVPQGGNYDGAAGVIAGLLALIAFRRAGLVPPRPVRLFGIRAEESAWFGRCYLGSLAMTGGLTAADLDRPHRNTGRPLADYMAAAGADMARIRRGDRLIDPADYIAFIEVHIEQGPFLESQGVPVGIVTGIRGNIRHHAVVCHGEAGHSGAVPRALRHDAVLAMAALMAQTDEQWQSELERGGDLVVTFGMVATDPDKHAMSRIPDEVRFSVDLRSQSRSTLETVYAALRAGADRIGRERGVRFAFDPPVLSPPGIVAGRLVDHLSGLCDRLALPHRRLPSGGGHDAAVFAEAGIPTGMIFVRNQNGSHNPDEAMAIDDLMAATTVLFQFLKEPLP